MVMRRLLFGPDNAEDEVTCEEHSPNVAKVPVTGALTVGNGMRGGRNWAWMPDWCGEPASAPWTECTE